MKTFDVVVVGNGAIGHATAHALTLADSSLKIAVVGEAERPGAASTAAGAMLGTYGEVTESLRQSPSGRLKMEDSVRAYKLWPKWLAGLNETLDPSDQVTTRNGTFIILNGVGGMLDSVNFIAIHKTLVEDKEPFEEIDPSTIPGISPLPPSRPLRALYIPNESVIESDRLLNAYTVAAQRGKQITLVNDRATGLRVAESKVVGVETVASGLVTAPNVVLAAGAFTQQILDTLPALARRIPRIFSGGGTSLLLDREWCWGNKRAASVPHCVRTPNRSLACGLHMVPRGDDHVYIGATNYLSIKAWDRPNLSDMYFLLECAMEQLNQDFVWAKLVRWNAGNRPVAVDTCPLVGKTSLDGLWIISGTFRDGLHMSPLLAQQVADEIVNVEQVTAEMFRPERPPINAMNREEAIKDLLMHADAAGWEHKCLNGTKIGYHLAIPDMRRSFVERAYEEMGNDYVLPPSLMPLIAFGQVDTGYFKRYYSETKAAWS